MSESNVKSPVKVTRYGPQRFLPLLAELWILATLVAFLVVRIAGSNTGKHLIDRLTGR